MWPIQNQESAQGWRKLGASSAQARMRVERDHVDFSEPAVSAVLSLNSPLVIEVRTYTSTPTKLTDCSFTVFAQDPRKIRPRPAQG